MLAPRDDSGRRRVLALAAAALLTGALGARADDIRDRITVNGFTNFEFEKQLEKLGYGDKNGSFDADERAELPLAAGRHAWVQVARGKLRVNGQELAAGDGAALSEESRVSIEGVQDGELLVFDLA